MSAGHNAATSTAPHTLVVGGTGMLRDLCLALALRGHTVSVIAQDTRRLESLVEEAATHGARVHPLPVDYGHEIQLENRIRAAIAAQGPISLAVCWIHSDSPRALPTIARVIARTEAIDRDLSPDASAGPGRKRPRDQRGDASLPRVFRILGSGTVSPMVAHAADTATESFPNIAWRRIVLGFKFGSARTGLESASRWLTHEEIWKGTLAAIDNDWTESVIGLVSPWEKRPK